MTSPPSPRSIASMGLAKIGLVLRSQAWKIGEARGLMPTHGQILALLRQRGDHPGRLASLAAKEAVLANRSKNRILPYHAGALRHFAERGIDVPEKRRWSCSQSCSCDATPLAAA